VATIVFAPKVGKHTPDLALLQLTSASTATPATLPASTTRARRGAKVRARGWRSANRRAVTRRGKVLRAAKCSSGARKTHALCAALKGKVPARRCKDAAGAALTRNGVLVGVGAKGRRGCRKAPRATFTNLLRKGVQTWITTATTPPSTTQPTPTAPSFYVGTFSGTVSQDYEGQSKSYTAFVRIDKDGNVGEIVGGSEYDTFSCGGSLTLLSRTAEGGLALKETLAYGQPNCLDGGTVLLNQVAGQDAVTYSWTRGPADGRASGVLARVH
jgi:hypothetical protein